MLCRPYRAPANEALAQKIMNLHLTVPKAIEINLSKVPDTLNDLIISKTDFTDDEWADIPAIHLFTTRLTLRSADVGALLFLAFQLYTPGCHGRTNKLFEEPRFVTIDDVLYFSLSSDRYDTIVGTSDVVVPSEGISEYENARAYAFLAASTLRLFTKFEKR
ncbi:hypothetical protein Q3G72_008113 [Acer saccharum]|nr:hypothetical protein Q3G72_008113 [Acer saccharum]